MSLPTIAAREAIGESIMPPRNPGQATVTKALYAITRDFAEVVSAIVDKRTPRALGRPRERGETAGRELRAADVFDQLDYVRCATSQRLGVGWEPVPRPKSMPAFDLKSDALRDPGAWNEWGRADVRNDAPTFLLRGLKIGALQRSQLL